MGLWLCVRHIICIVFPLCLLTEKYQKCWPWELTISDRIKEQDHGRSTQPSEEGEPAGGEKPHQEDHKKPLRTRGMRRPHQSLARPSLTAPLRQEGSRASWSFLLPPPDPKPRTHWGQADGVCRQPGGDGLCSTPAARAPFHPLHAVPWAGRSGRVSHRGWKRSFICVLVSPAVAIS